MIELVTKNDLAGAVQTLRQEMNTRLENVQLKMDGIHHHMDVLRRDVDAKIERSSLQLTIRLGALKGAGLGTLAVILRLH